ncbi:hypothetical protein B0H10DRAFT_2197131 [Mycena sp. CBHHK59/15]|nr:hypothetical protein B0H10DRAFT_2197131 [Mycena sp. CBHHK59/15]
MYIDQDKHVSGVEYNWSSDEDDSGTAEEITLNDFPGNVLTHSFKTQDLLGEYLIENPDAQGEDWDRDMQKLQPRYFLRSMKHIMAEAQEQTASQSPPPQKLTLQEQKYVRASGKLIVHDGGWVGLTGTGPLLQPINGPEMSTMGSNSEMAVDPSPPRTTRRKTRRSTQKPDHGIRRTFARADVVAANMFRLVEGASVSQTGWHGALPPPIARNEILRLYKETPNSRGLHEYIAQFYPVRYNVTDKERSVFLVDANEQIFAYRSYRAMWMQEEVNEIHRAIGILVGDDLQCTDFMADCKAAMRGPHMPIIIGHHRQSAKKPLIAKWHDEHQRRVTEFMGVPVVSRIITFVEDRVQTVFPGVAKQFRKDAQVHWEKHKIKPMFGLFWNFCLNTYFPGQDRVHCYPHTDKKNQIANFNDTVWTWLVIWEAGVAIQMPPWTVAIYPSSLFYHFNIDVQDIDAQPTPENTRPIQEGDREGRGSMVFFNQATMRTLPETGHDTLKEARHRGHSGTSDFTGTAQEIFSRTRAECACGRISTLNVEVKLEHEGDHAAQTTAFAYKLIGLVTDEP